ncbi:hypothetical protein M1247_18430 [Mycobacterium sp. 21AC1]|uniref:DUF6199 family natural product biosynthesis protein n=1 Tax=[Mycobacterium] appelbergii TaxID=2939269 RepID=UPI0029391B32|nr:DUF6199 family natural product biosynthesis protein [Mycobacterium sp. 21AC1]MDV3126905.1 hypothetical protein [Mycobacterium sp. 21AC1]
MGPAIVCLLVGIPIGLFLLLRPRQIWWTFQSWKYKNPEANEPSDAAYGMSALGGLGVIVLAIFLAAMLWSSDGEKRAAEAEKQKKADWDAAVAAYDPPEPEDRGMLPIIGYTERGPRQTLTGRIEYEVFYRQPAGAYPYRTKDYRYDRAAGPSGRFQCLTIAGDRGPVVENSATVYARLSWEPYVPQSDSSASEQCTTDDLSSGDIGSEKVYLCPGTRLVTESPVVDAHGSVLLAAKPGNAVPKLAAAPTR